MLCINLWCFWGWGIWAGEAVAVTVCALPPCSGGPRLRQCPAQHAPLPGRARSCLPARLQPAQPGQRGHLPHDVLRAGAGPAAPQRHLGQRQVPAGRPVVHQCPRGHRHRHRRFHGPEHFHLPHHHLQEQSGSFPALCPAPVTE